MPFHRTSLEGGRAGEVVVLLLLSLAVCFRSGATKANGQRQKVVLRHFALMRSIKAKGLRTTRAAPLKEFIYDGAEKARAFYEKA
jgi:hypothetical protein